MVAVDLQAFFDGFFLVVGALHQGFARHVVNAFDFGWVEFDVVGATAGHVGAATAHAFDDGVKGHIDFEHEVQLHASRFHGVGLRNGAGEAVKQEALGAIGLGDAFFDQVDDQVIADQTASIHHFFGFDAQRGTGFDCSAQHVACGNLGNAVFLANEGGLCTFTGTRCAQQNQSHALS